MRFRPCLRAGLLGAHRAKRKWLGVGRSLRALGPVHAALGARGAVCKDSPVPNATWSKRMPLGLSGVDKQEQIYTQRRATCWSSRRLGWKPLLGWPRGSGEPARLDTASICWLGGRFWSIFRCHDLLRSSPGRSRNTEGMSGVEEVAFFNV